MREGVVLLDLQGAVAYASPACELLGLAPDRVVGQHVSALLCAPEPSTPAVESALGLRGGPVSQDDHDVVLVDGRTLSARISDVRDDPDLQGLVVHLRDVTAERHQLVEAARRNAIVELLHVSTAAANRSTDLEEALRLVLDAVCRHFGWKVGHARVVTDPGGPLGSSRLWAGSAVQDPSPVFEEFRRVSEASSFSPGVGLPGRVLASGAPLWVTDVTQDPNFPRAPQARAAGLGAAAAFPLVLGEEVLRRGPTTSPAPRIVLRVARFSRTS